MTNINRLTIGEVVYHVANPFVSGLVMGCARVSSRGNEYWVPVEFSQEVGFSGNKSAGLRRHWLCSSSLLFLSPREAKENHNTNWERDRQCQ